MLLSSSNASLRTEEIFEKLGHCSLALSVLQCRDIIIGLFCVLTVLQMGEEMSQNSFIKQYLAKQQELLRQRLQREAQQDEEEDGMNFTRAHAITNQTLNTVSGIKTVIL